MQLFRVLRRINHRYGFNLIVLSSLLIIGCGGGGPEGTLPANWPAFNLPVMNPDQQILVSTVSDVGGVVTSAKIQGGGIVAFSLGTSGRLLVDTGVIIQTLAYEHSSDVYAEYFGALHDYSGRGIGWIDVWSGGHKLIKTYIRPQPQSG